MSQQFPHQTAPVQPTPHKKRRRWVPWAVGAGLFFLGLIIGSSGGGSTPAASTTPTTTVTVPTGIKTIEVEVPGPTTTVTAPAPKVSPPAPKKPAGLPTTIEEGQWEVGVDVAPGRYKTTAAVGGTCYWKITPTGKPDDIVDNDIVSGGKPVVTIKKGQDFHTQRCGTWTKVG
jgi:hypothetical protein